MAIFFCPQYPNTTVYQKLSNGKKKRFVFSEHYLTLSDSEDIKFFRGRIFDGEKDFVELTGPSSHNGKHKYLLQRQGGIGDILFTTPLAKYLKELGHEVNYYLHFGYFEVLQHNPYIDEVFINRRIAKNLQLPAGFGQNLLGIEGFEYRTKFPRHMNKERYAEHTRPIIFNGVIEHNPIAETDHAVDVCYRYANIDPEGKPKKMIVNITDAERFWAKNNLLDRGYNPKKKFIGIAPNASYAKNRSWPKAYADKLTERLTKYFNVVYLHRGQGWSLRESMRIVSQMDLMICTDTGLLHVAGALDRKVIALFGPFNPDYRCRYIKDCAILCHTEEVCGGFCFNHADKCNKFNIEKDHPPCMDIKPEEVFQTVKEMI